MPSCFLKLPNHLDLRHPPPNFSPSLHHPPVPSDSGTLSLLTEPKFASGRIPGVSPVEASRSGFQFSGFRSIGRFTRLELKSYFDRVLESQARAQFDSGPQNGRTAVSKNLASEPVASILFDSRFKGTDDRYFRIFPLSRLDLSFSVSSRASSANLPLRRFCSSLFDFDPAGSVFLWGFLLDRIFRLFGFLPQVSGSSPSPQTDFVPVASESPVASDSRRDLSQRIVQASNRGRHSENSEGLPKKKQRETETWENR